HHRAWMDHSTALEVSSWRSHSENTCGAAHRCYAGADLETRNMTIRGKAFIAGAWEHPTRYAPDKSIAQIHAECALGALRDAGLGTRDVDGYFCAGDAPGASTVSMAEYLNLHLAYMDGTDLGGCSAIAQVGHAAAA